MSATTVVAVRSGEQATRPLVPGEEPPLAAHLVTPRSLYFHHGLYVGPTDG